MGVFVAGDALKNAGAVQRVKPRWAALVPVWYLLKPFDSDETACIGCKSNGILSRSRFFAKKACLREPLC